MPCDVQKYRLGPFVLASAFRLPELPEETEAVPDVVIRSGTVPVKLDDVVANESRWWASREEYLLRVPGVAGFLVSRGREVVVEAAEGALEGDIRAYLLAPIFSALCYQAGMYSLHASSVRAGDGVVAFLGNSGAGKSTLAACLERRGYPVISDDICLLDPREAGKMVVVPVAPALKLWRNALEYLGEAPEELPKVFSLNEKYRMTTGSALEKERLPLREIYFLEWAEAGGAEFQRLEGVHALTRLMEFTHFEYLMKPTGRRAGSFQMSGRLLSQVGAFRFRRPRDFAQVDRVVDALERQMRRT